MSHLILSHLSKNNNSTQLVYDLFLPHSGSVQIVVASRYEETPVYHIKTIGSVQETRKNEFVISAEQLTLFQ